MLPVDVLKDCKIAEIGSGAGRIVFGLARAGAAKIYAVEPSHAIAVTRKSTKEFQDRIEYLQVAGDELPTGLNLDYVVAIGVLQHIPGPDSVVRAAHSTLRDGKVAVTEQAGKQTLQFRMELKQGSAGPEVVRGTVLEALRRESTSAWQTIGGGLVDADFKFYETGQLRTKRKLMRLVDERDYA